MVSSKDKKELSQSDEDVHDLACNEPINSDFMDLDIEIVSPSTASIDYIKKLYLYERKMVKEYCIVYKNLVVFEPSVCTHLEYRLYFYCTDDSIKCIISIEFEDIIQSDFSDGRFQISKLRR